MKTHFLRIQEIKIYRKVPVIVHFPSSIMFAFQADKILKTGSINFLSDRYDT
jgi:hypothetical protein